MTGVGVPDVARLAISARDSGGSLMHQLPRLSADTCALGPGQRPVTECDPASGLACCLPAMRAAAGAGLPLPQPVLVVLVRMLDQRQGHRLLVLEQVRRPDLNGFGLAPCGKDHRFVLEQLLIDVDGRA